MTSEDCMIKNLYIIECDIQQIKTDGSIIGLEILWLIRIILQYILVRFNNPLEKDHSVGR